MSRRAVLMAFALAALTGCSATDEPRAQWLVVLDTDMPTVAQADEQHELDATVDTLLVEVVAPGGRVESRREFGVGDPRDWPVTFGVVTPGPDAETLLRVRLFRGAFSHPSAGEGEAFSRPVAALSVDRLVRLHGPDSQVHKVRVLLAGDCLGIPANFLSGRTCVNGSAPDADPSEGLDTASPDQPSAAGTWDAARTVPCAGEPPAGTRCIPGGVSVLGDEDWVGYVDSSSMQAGAPLRVARLSPFYMDETELTVGTLRKLVAQGRLTGELPKVKDPENLSWQDCTWLGVDIPDNDDMPVSCLPWATAREVCRAVGGDLPSESQWERAARGHGAHRSYPWGEAPPACCNVVAARSSFIEKGLCPGAGPEHVGSRADPNACNGSADSSLDGILDLAGNVAEYCVDVARPYDDPCWASTGLALDPVCAPPEAGLHSVRGNSWSTSLGYSDVSLRFDEILSATRGFRCVYPGSAP